MEKHVDFSLIFDEQKTGSATETEANEEWSPHSHPGPSEVSVPGSFASSHTFSSSCALDSAFRTVIPQGLLFLLLTCFCQVPHLDSVPSVSQVKDYGPPYCSRTFIPSHRRRVCIGT